MVVIRLTRVGKKKQAHYRIVVADSQRAVQGKFISILGWYNPHTKELEVKKDELKSWLDKGAQPSNTLAKLLKKEGVKLPKWVKIVEKKKAPKKKEEPKEAAPKAEAKEETKPAEGEAAEDAAEKAEETTAEVQEDNKAEAVEEKKEEKSEEASADETEEEPATEEKPAEETSE